MKLFSAGVVSGFLFFALSPAFANTYPLSLSLCPQDGRNDLHFFHTGSLNVDGGSVALSSGGSEPNFSSEIQWAQDGKVYLVRKNKINILLGQGARPGLREACGKFPFQQNSELNLSLKTSFGAAYPHCGETGCHVVHPRDDELMIQTKDEKIVYVGQGESSVSSIENSNFSRASLLVKPAAKFLENVKVNNLPYKQRMGYQLESSEVPFKACVIYLEGLGDSIQNHAPFFDKLSAAGYRVLMFDYLGQGGSEGSMAKTRINSSGAPFLRSLDYEIGTQARFVWDRYSQKKDPVFNRSCAESPKIVIGWSTGGLAGYKLASERWPDVSVLIAPALVPRLCVGETADDCLANMYLDKVITQRTLTSNSFADIANPHLDPVKPASIVKEIKEFGTNLIATGFESRGWPMSANTKALVFLSGPKDSYVNRDKTKEILLRNAPSFKIVSYDQALHEIDNEVPAIANDMHLKTIQFLDAAMSDATKN